MSIKNKVRWWGFIAKRFHGPLFSAVTQQEKVLTIFPPTLRVGWGVQLSGGNSSCIHAIFLDDCPPCREDASHISPKTGTHLSTGYMSVCLSFFTPLLPLPGCSSLTFYHSHQSLKKSLFYSFFLAYRMLLSFFLVKSISDISNHPWCCIDWTLNMMSDAFSLINF